MLLNRQAGFQTRRLDIARLKSIATLEQIIQAREAVKAIQVSKKIIDYLWELVRATRQYPDLALGASWRSAVAWLQSSKASAWLLGRDYVNPDDIQVVAPPLLRHQLILKPEALLDGLMVEAVISSMLDRVAVPR